MNRQKVLVTGGAGYLGSHLVEQLIEAGYEVTVYDSLFYTSEYTNRKVRFVKGDLRDTVKLNDLFSCNKFDAIFLCASLVGDPLCKRFPDITFDINTKSIKWFADNIKCKLIFCSTCSVYGVNNHMIDENGITNPLSEYARSKLDAEQYLLQKRPESFIVRYGTLMGAAADFGRNRMDLVVNVLTRNAANGQLLNINGGDQFRPLLHVSDASDVLIHGYTKNLMGIYNVAVANYTINQIALRIKNKCNCDVMYSQMSGEDARNYKVDCRKIMHTGWTPIYWLEDAIDEIYELIKNNRIDGYDPRFNNANLSIEKLQIG